MQRVACERQPVSVAHSLEDDLHAVRQGFLAQFVLKINNSGQIVHDARQLILVHTIAVTTLIEL